MNETILIIILFFIILIFIFMHFKEVKYIESFKGTKYLVRNVKDCQQAANILQQIVDRIEILLKHVYNKNKIKTSVFKQYVNIIYQKFPTILFRESTSKNKFTSYSVNKGEEIVMCLRSKSTHELHDLNEILYVAIHEIAHVGCPEIGHTDLFNKINTYLLENAVECKVYQYKNYDMKPEEYCGIEITTTLLNRNSNKSDSFH